MNNIFSTQFRQILLLVDQHLTTQDKERFRFYCSSFLPKSVKSMLEIFEVLEDQHVISYQDVKLLKEFSITIGRNDVAKLLAEYETRVSLKMIIYGYLDFRSGCRNVKSPMLLTTDCVSKHLVNGGSHSHDRVKVVVKKLHGTFALKFAFGNFIDKCFPISTEKYRWNDVLDVIQICAEFVYLRWMYMRNFKQMMSDIEEVVEDVLRIRIVPWMMKNGGMSGCYSVVAPVQNW
ncbi:uncharacterized protein LOC116298740 [Actinia tenebrosa]|uniref:Uncharacterized protein LOC116298740 n=1 Tax=Actinia tenebrosa TaxID=6105 RepID=A0A6P8I5D5_ACTTE|nr:uncharacterized protein LOC116298740 [Actinia tenebrosa]